jgi:lipopolysaccharide transport system permease protein
MSSAPDAAAAGPRGWVIEPTRSGLAAALREMWQYRRLLVFFGSQTIKGLYAGTTLGIFWLFARPLLPVFISTFVFGSLLQVPSNGIPYFLFFLIGTSVWMLFDRSLLWATRSLDQQKGLIKKLYFPRLIVPIAAVSPAIVYFGIYLALIVGGAVYYFVTTGRWYLALGPGWLIAFAAAAIAIVMAVTAGLFTSVWQARHREVRFGLRYAMSFWFYLTPVIYPMSQVPDHLHWVIYLNPMASVVETFRWGLLGVGLFPAVPLLTSVAIVLVVGAFGVWYFTQSEAASVDSL